MFPDIDCQNRFQTVGERIGGVSSLSYEESAFIVGRYPYPAGSEEGSAGLLDLGLEIFDRAILFLDLLFQLARRLFETVWRELEEIEDMVPGLRGVVEKLSFALADNLLERHLFERRILYERVEGIDICFLMFAVMEIDSYRRDHRCESIGSIR